MKFKRRPSPPALIPSASMSDIVFSLLLFFMVSTVIRKYSGLPVQLPEANQIEKLQTKTHSSYFWIDEGGNMAFDDYPISSLDDVYKIARQKIQKDKQLLIFLRVDKNLKMGALSDVQEQLRKAGAYRIFYGARSITEAGY
jgi:biopolymer transport protein ExbD